MYADPPSSSGSSDSTDSSGGHEGLSVDEGVTWERRALEAGGLLADVPGADVLAMGLEAYEYGSKLDKATGASDKISDVMPGGRKAAAATNAAVSDGVTPMTGKRWAAENAKIDLQEEARNGSPMSRDKKALEMYRLDHNVPLGDDPQAAMSQVCEPYAR
jgi:hypothetical protein